MTTPRAEPGAVGSARPGRPTLALGGGLLRRRPWRSTWSSALARRLRRRVLVAVVFAAWPWPRACGALVGAVGRSPRRSPAAALAAAASARAVLLSAARALPAAVWAPLALVDLPAAMRALAALAAAALPVTFVTRPDVWTWSPPSAALTLMRQARLAARGGVRVDGAGLRRAIERRQRIDEGDGRGVGVGRVGGHGQGLGDVGLRGGAPRAEDVVTACRLADALESRRRPGARPGAGRLGQGENLVSRSDVVAGHRDTG